ncbi:MAG TPA: OB-fold nucleic acid binding domain-containing protein [Desulfomonilaceae bacterium]|nr:OB-fold nucleic acid binding domain-containing protein [Desulfomonilaceae bacterium]
MSGTPRESDECASKANPGQAGSSWEKVRFPDSFSESEPASSVSALKAYQEAGSMSVFCHGHPLAPLRPYLSAQGIVTARDLRRIVSGSIVQVCGILVIVHTPPTKSGKRVIFITMEDETGLMDVVAFPKAQVDFAEAIWTSEVLTVEGRLQRQGRNGLSISIIMERLIMPWTGKLSDFLPRVV